MSSYRSMTGYGTLTPPGYGAAAPGGFSLADFAAMVSARRNLILGITLGIVALAGITVLLLPTVYSSSAVVMLDQRKNNITDISAVLSQLPNDPATMQNQVQLATSRELASKVIANLQLYNDPDYNPTLSHSGASQALADLGTLLNPKYWFEDTPPVAAADIPRIHDQIMANFLKHVSAEAVGLSTSMAITFTASDPEKAARIANALAQAYVQDQIDLKRDATAQTINWLNQRINDLGQEMQAQDEAVQIYKARHGLNDSAPGSSLVDQQMAGINGQIVQARSDLAEKQAAAERVNGLIQSGNPADVSQVVSSPLIVQLRTQQADLVRQEGDMASKYGPLHPKMQALEAQKRDLDQKVTQEVNRIAGSLSSDLAVARAHLNSLQNSLGGAEQESTNQNMARVQLQALQSNAASTRTQYEAFLTRLRSAQDPDTLSSPESRIISPAPIPLEPSQPKRLLIVAASLPLGLLLGVLAALIVERFGYLIPVRVTPRASLAPPAPMRTRPRRAQAAPKVIPAPPWKGPPILAEIADPATLKAGDYVLDYPKSRYAHGMAALVRQLESSDGAAVIVVTAAEAGENKSAIGVSLARAAALLGKKTVLIDCDPGQAATGAMHAQAKAGLYEVLTGALPLNQAFAKDPRTNAMVLAMTRQPPNLPTMFASQQMTKLIDILRGGCEMVVIDCARAGDGPEAALLARLGDATMLVSRQAALYAPSLSRSVEILNSAKAAPVGIVVTK